MLKTLVFASLTVLVTGARNPHLTCGDCHHLSEALSHASTSPGGIDAVIRVITGPVCGVFIDDPDCVEHVDIMWKEIAPELFNQHDGWFSKEWLCSDICNGKFFWAAWCS